MADSQGTSGRIDIADLGNKADALLNQVSGAVRNSRTRAVKDSLHLVEDLLSDVASALYELRKEDERTADEPIDPADMAGQRGGA